MDKCIEEVEIKDRDVQRGRDRVYVQQEPEYVVQVVNGAQINISIPGAAQRN